MPLYLRTLLAFSLVVGAAAASPVHAQSAAETPPETTTPAIQSAAEGLYVEFGRGVRLAGEEGGFGLTLRGRVQSRATFRSHLDDNNPDTPPSDLSFQIRRARLVLLGDLPDQNLQLYMQLGFSSGDLDSTRPVPLRDAVLTWTPTRDVNLRVGQMKVNYSRERVISSSALQFADRSGVNAEFNLDRDVGVQLFSNDLFGLDERLSWQFGAYGGAGRNRTNTGTGLLYVGRLQFNPLGAFSDSLVEADIGRSRQPRLSIGATAGLHADAEGALSNRGALLTFGPQRTTHYGLDVLFKVAGFSLQSEFLVRDVDGPTLVDVAADPTLANVDITLGRSGRGLLVQTGYVFAKGYEIAARLATIEPLNDSDVVASQQPALAFGKYFLRHDLKLQGDYTLLFNDGAADPEHELRVQLQFYF
jgi:phosphate-selective porin